MAFSKFLDPKNDVAFRRIFGTEKNKDILIHFLNDILGFTGKDEIKEIEFLSTIQDAEIASKKQSIVDVLCKDSQGSRYIIEMQFTKTKGFEKRAQYYAAKAYSSQADQGDDYHNLKEIIFIAVADCIIFPDKAEYKSNHTIRDENTNEHDLKDFYFVFIELPKFTKMKEDQLENIVEKWCYQLCFLKNFYLCDSATLPSHMGNKNPFVIEIEFYVKQLPQQFLLKPMNMCFKSVWTYLFTIFIVSYYCVK